jgi:hypothetical protein
MLEWLINDFVKKEFDQFKNIRSFTDHGIKLNGPHLLVALYFYVI